MPVKFVRSGNNIISEFYGLVGAEDARETIDGFLKAYHHIGDAIGFILDFSQMTRITLGSMRTAQSKAHLLTIDAPVAVIIGEVDEVVLHFLAILDQMTGQRDHKMAYYQNREDATAYLEQWFIDRGVEREQLVGVLSAFQQRKKQQR